MKKLLITRPDHDDTTHYLAAWSKKVLEVATEKSVKLYDLMGERANKDETTSIMQKEAPGLVVFNGHGDENCVTGYKNEVLIIAGTNESLLKGKITYAISCRSAKRLGPKSVESGARAYIGYDDDFVFSYNINKMKTPLQDQTVRLFLEPSNEVVISLVKGNSALVSHQRSKQFFRERINKIMSSESTPEDTAMVRYLWWDMVHQVCLGNPDAVFE